VCALCYKLFLNAGENENIIEGGGDEWMEFVSFYIGKNSYDDSDWTDDDHDKLSEFIYTILHDLFNDITF
jgi:hypothetical protein